jgi:hypothetical protein
MTDNPADARFAARFLSSFESESRTKTTAFNPAAKIKKKTEDNRRIRFLVYSEEKILLPYIEEHYPSISPHSSSAFTPGSVEV